MLRGAVTGAREQRVEVRTQHETGIVGVLGGAQDGLVALPIVNNVIAKKCMAKNTDLNMKDEQNNT